MKQRFSKRTRLVSALLTLAMVFTFLPFSAFAAAGGDLNVPLDNFPDETFREYLRTKFDKDGNGALNTDERNAVTKIDVDGKGIETLEGIQHFLKLETLWCSDNQLTKLDVTQNKALQELYCDNNQLTSLDVTQNKALQELDCAENQLTSLDVTQNEALQELDCSKNNLNSLDVSRNTALLDLNCSQNNLTSLDVGNNAALINLVCWKNQLTSLDVSNNPELKFLNCDQNQLTSLNVEKTNIYLSNPYSGFHAKNNTYPISVGSDRTFDLSTLPGKFEVSKASGWVGGTVSGSTLTVDENATEVTYAYNCGNGRSETFTLNVNVVPDGSTGGETGGGSTGGSSGGGGGGGGAIIAVAGAAAVGLVGYGIYNYVAERQLQALLPEGAAIPENRAQTALLLWNTAGRPEPAAQPAFPDVADPDTAKAAQWCVEHGLMNAKFRGRFAPDGSSPAYKTLNAYRQLVG